MRPMTNPTGKHRPKRRHHGEGSVIKRTDRWRARPWAAVIPYVNESGQRREMWLSAGSRDEAEAIRRREVARIRKGIIPTAETVGQYMSAWLETVEVGPGTWPRYRQHLTERILPSFGDVALDRLTPQQVRRAVIDWSGSPQTRGGTLRLLRAGLRQAVADRRIEHDPTEGIPYPKVPRHEPRTLTGPEARKLMATVKGERFAPILVLSLGLGVRRGEALGLRTVDVNWEVDDEYSRLDADGHLPGVRVPPPQHEAIARAHAGRTPVSVTIAKSLRYIAPSMRAEGEDAYRLTSTKTGETREMRLPRFVAEALAERLVERDREKRAAKVWAGNDLVFCTPLGNSVALETLYRWFKGALKRAELPPMRWHDLRSSCATVLYEMDVPEIITMAILGHRDLATTRRYVGKTPKALGAAADKMQEAMG